MPQAPRSGTWKRAGVALMVVGFVNIFVVVPGGSLIASYSKLLWVILVLLTPTLMSAGAFLSWRGRQYAAQESAESVVTDAKPHLLYLRHFRTDYTTVKEVRRAQLVPTEEEQLADVLRPFGELVAIGRPGETLPTPGAARIYTSDEDWREAVKRQMQTARLVVITAALGENVLWELTQAVATLEPQKVLIVILQMKAEDYESFRTQTTPILGVSLPERATLWRFARREPEMWSRPTLSGFISFAADWKPNFLAAKKAPFFRTDAYDSFKSRAKYALRPVFENFGLEWQPPPFRVSQIFVVIFGILAGLVVVAVILLMLLGAIFCDWLDQC